MQINFTARNMELTPALKTFTQEKMDRLQSRYANIENIRVTFQIKKNDQLAEATIHLYGTDLHASAAAPDMYSAIDLLIDKLVGQITKHKEKQTDHR